MCVKAAALGEFLSTTAQDLVSERGIYIFNLTIQPRGSTMHHQPAVSYRGEQPSNSYSCIEAIGPMLDRVYSLRYRGYSERGFIQKCASGKFMDEYDQRPNCTSFLLYSQAKVAATVRTCVYRPNMNFDIPALDVFGKEIEASIGLDSVFVEANKFVVDPSYQKKRGLELRSLIFKAAAEKTVQENARAFLIAVRSEHVRFYRKFRCFPISDAKYYPGLDFKTVLLASTEFGPALDVINSMMNRKALQHESLSRYGHS